MVQGDPRACGVFETDVEKTYLHLVERVAATQAASAGEEQIQLVPENAGSTISFNVPDGPPPERLQLEGPGFETVSVEEVRKALQTRWDLFQSFKPEMQAALKSGELDAVNRELGKMKVEDAEEQVRLFDVAGILNFSQHEVVDQTGAEEEDDGEYADAEEEGDGDDEDDGKDLE